MSDTIVTLVPSSQEILQQYQAAAVAQGAPTLAWSQDGYIMLADGLGKFIAGVTIFETKSSFTIFDDFVVNPEFPLRVRHGAGEMLVHQIIAHCAVLGKTALCPTQSKGAEMCLTRLGFEPADVVMMTRRPEAHPLDRIVEKKKPVVVETDWIKPKAEERRKPARRKPMRKAQRR